MLAEAEKAQAAAEARSKALSTEFDNNEKEINEVTTLLKQREGNLGELFGVTRQVAGDTANVMEQSIISAQYPDREEFLRSLASAKTLPSITELERLWFEMQREMTATGDVSEVRAPGRAGRRSDRNRASRAHRSVHDHVERQIPVVPAVAEEPRGADAVSRRASS